MSIDSLIESRIRPDRKVVGETTFKECVHIFDDYVEILRGQLLGDRFGTYSE